MTKFDRFRAWVHATAKDEIVKAIHELKTDFYERMTNESDVIYKRLRNELEMVIKKYVDQKIDSLMTNHFVDLLRVEIEQMIKSQVAELKDTISYKLVIGGRKK